MKITLPNGAKKVIGGARESPLNNPEVLARGWGEARREAVQAHAAAAAAPPPVSPETAAANAAYVSAATAAAVTAANARVAEMCGVPVGIALAWAAKQASGSSSKRENADGDWPELGDLKWPELSGEVHNQIDMRQLQVIVAQQQQITGVPGDQLMTVHKEVSSATEAQIVQQRQFQAQMLAFEREKMKLRGGVSKPSVNRFKEGFLPMQLCKVLSEGRMCMKGDQCTFAHTLDELHQASPDYIQLSSGALAEQDITRDDFRTQQPIMQMRRKREMCQRYLHRGGCLLGTKCMYAHTEDEIGVVTIVYNDRVKAQLCKYWERSGKCINGSYCVSAHGMEEIGQLKPPEDLIPPSKKYRT